MASEYLKNRDDNAGVDVDIEDDRYSISLEVDEFEDIAEDLDYYGDIEEFLETLEESECEELRVEVTLEGEYIQSIGFYAQCDDEEQIVIAIEFDSVNELTKETSLAYKLYNELKEEADAEEAVAKETEDVSVVESDFSTEVEVKFNCFAYWIDNINYSHNVLHLYQNPGEGNAQFNMSYDIDENCKWMKATEEGEEDWGIEGNDIAAQKLVDVVTYSNAMYEKCIQAGNADYADKNYPYRSEVCYNLILKGYSTSENSATITEVLLLHNDVRFDYGDDNQYRTRY